MYAEGTRVEKGTSITLFIAALLTTVLDAHCNHLDAHRQGMDKEVVVGIDNGILISLRHKKECLRVSSDEVNEPRTCYSE